MDGSSASWASWPGRIRGALALWRDRAGPGWWLLPVGVVTGGVAALFPLTRAIDYPLSLVGCVILSLAGAVAGALGGAYGTSGPRGPLRRFGVQSLSMLQAVAALLVIPALSSQLSGRPCEPLYGLLFVVAGPLSSGVCGVAVGVVAGRLLRRPGWAVAAAVAFVAASPLVAVGEFLLTPCVRFYGTFFGLYHGAIYDEAVFAELPYLWLRVWNVLAVGGGLLALQAATCARAREAYAAGEGRAPGGRAAGAEGGGREWPKSWSGAAAAVLLCLSSLVLAFGPELGFVASQGPLEERLSGRLAGPHVVVRYAPGGRAAEVAGLMLDDLEFRHEQIRGWFGLSSVEPVTAWLYDSERQKSELMGAGRTSIAKPWLRQLHVHELQPGAAVLAHELAHVMLASATPSLLGLPTGAWGLPRPGLMEGAAVSVERGGERMTTHQWARAMQEVGFLPDVAAILDGLGFWGESAQRAYTACGSFVRFLVETRGPGAFVRVYGGETFDGAYGASLDSLVREWQRFLEAVPLSDGDQELARLVFSRPPVFDRVCPYAGGRCLERATRAVRRKEPAHVLRLAAQAMAMTHRDLQTGLRLVRLLLAAGNAEGGLWAASRLSAAIPSEAGGAAVAAVDLARADAHWLAGEAETAAAIYGRLANGPAGGWLKGPLRLRLLLAGRALPAEVVELLLDAFPGNEGPERATAVLARKGSGPAERFKAAAVMSRRPAGMAEAERELAGLTARLVAEPEVRTEAMLLRLRLLCFLGRPGEARKAGLELLALDLAPALREETQGWLDRAGWLESAGR
ncbi:MAG: hypothetical protein FJ109_03875 [Deltaproteobacteria bacterium]|nr:hypothetical protein [Deltaproteobacteria bacterium]